MFASTEYLRHMDCRTSCLGYLAPGTLVCPLTQLLRTGPFTCTFKVRIPMITDIQSRSIRLYLDLIV